MDKDEGREIEREIFALRRQVELELACGTTARAQELLDTIQKLESQLRGERNKP